ncbi:MAG: AAA family ATPase [bacterium]|nr:AAA family ATPase [bacterium]
MLTRLKVNGFKNLVGVEVAFGPFTCVAGANGVGKSNLFDAIQFLSGLADKSLTEAALSVRSEGERASDLRSIFHRVADRFENEMSFEVEMLVPPAGIDDLGQEARAAITFLRYELTLGLVNSGLTIRREHLSHITLGKARSHLPFPHRPEWRKSVVKGRRTSPFISTETIDGRVYIKLHQDLGKGYLGGGRPRRHVAEKLPRTVLSDANAAENSTAVLARREMQSWRLLQLEPSALRAPDPYSAPSSMATNGAHLPATLARLAQLHSRFLPEREARHGNADSEETTAVYARVANRLAELIDGVRSICVDADDRRELLTLMLTEGEGTEHEARSLSDGTLRFLALAILENDPTAQGVLCLEEPENGIHPERIPAMLHLLRDIAVETEGSVGRENPLRQVIVNTHSPAVVGQVRDEDLLVATTELVPFEQWWCPTPSFRWLEGTWRAETKKEIPAVAPGFVVSYLSPHEPKVADNEVETLSGGKRRRRGTRVIDRPEIQMWLPGISQL